MKERIHWIDIAKGIAIICVFLGHTVSTPMNLASFIYLFHMPLFFLLSGYCFSARRRFGEFIINKAKSIVLPIFTLGLTGALVVAALMRFLKHEAVDWKWTVLNSVVQYKEHSLLWYLPCLFVALIIFYGLVKLFKDKPLPIVISSFALGLLSYAAIKLLSFDMPWNVPTALVALPFIAVGYSIKKKDFAEKLGHIWVPIAAFVGCVAAGYFNKKYFGGVEMHSNTYSNIALFYIAALLGSLMVVSASVLIKKNAMLEFFGRNSLIFYALEPAQYIVNFALKTMSLDSPSNVFVTYAVTIGAVVVICAIFSAAAYIINRFLPFLIGKSIKKSA